MGVPGTYRWNNEEMQLAVTRAGCCIVDDGPIGFVLELASDGRWCGETHFRTHTTTRFYRRVEEHLHDLDLLGGSLSEQLVEWCEHALSVYRTAFLNTSLSDTLFAPRQSASPH